MKALKVVLVVVLMSFTMLGIAQNADRVKPMFDSKMIPVTTLDIRTDLGNAVRAQVDETLFLTRDDHSGIYIASVRLNGKIYKIYGTYKQWKRFLYVQPKLLPFEKADNGKKKID